MPSQLSKAAAPRWYGYLRRGGVAVFSEVTAQFPSYTFQITEGPQSQKILVGFKSNLSVFITPKPEFKDGTTHMRPDQPFLRYAAINQDP